MACNFNLDWTASSCDAVVAAKSSGYFMMATNPFARGFPRPLSAFGHYEYKKTRAVETPGKKKRGRTTVQIGLQLLRWFRVEDINSV
jgi:hypothetical protein